MSAGEEAAVARSPGAILQAARKERDLNPREVADRLCWRPDYVAVIERDAYEELRNPAFAKGYVKSYGELVGVDRERLMAAFEALQRSRGDHDRPPRPIRCRNLQIQRGGRAATVGVVMLLLLLGVLWWWHGRGDDAEGDTEAFAPGAALPQRIESTDDHATSVL